MADETTKTADRSAERNNFSGGLGHADEKYADYHVEDAAKEMVDNSFLIKPTPKGIKESLPMLIDLFSAELSQGSGSWLDYCLMACVIAKHKYGYDNETASNVSVERFLTVRDGDDLWAAVLTRIGVPNFNKESEGGVKALSDIQQVRIVLDTVVLLLYMAEETIAKWKAVIRDVAQRTGISKLATTLPLPKKNDTEGAADDKVLSKITKIHDSLSDEDIKDIVDFINGILMVLKGIGKLGSDDDTDISEEYAEVLKFSKRFYKLFRTWSEVLKRKPCVYADMDSDALMGKLLDVKEHIVPMQFTKKDQFVDFSEKIQDLSFKQKVSRDECDKYMAELISCIVASCYAIAKSSFDVSRGTTVTKLQEAKKELGSIPVGFSRLSIRQAYTTGNARVDKYLKRIFVQDIGDECELNQSLDVINKCVRFVDILITK